MLSILNKLFKHRHKWEDSGWNSYAIAIEQHCKCGAFRHHFWIDIKNNSPVWRDGMHPNSVLNK